LTMKSGVECEYFLISPDGNSIADPRDTQSKPCYDQSALMRRYDLIKEICDCMIEMGWGPYQNDHEDANGQFEMNWDYSDCLKTADRHTFFKYMVKTIAEKHGLRATFMPKPFENLTGNGCHAHISVWDGKKNKFLDNSNNLGLSKMAYNFLGGVIKHASSLSAFFNPTINSYRRINAPPTKSGASWSPSSISYTGNNRTHMIRIPDPGRFELRLMDGSANPYLLQAGVLAAGINGIRKRVNPGKPLFCNMYTDHKKYPNLKKLPNTLEESLDMLNSNTILKNAFGKDVLNSYLKLKNSEIWKWKNWEISWSLSKQSSSEKNIKILLVHGFGASKNHWRHNQDFLGKFSNCFAIDLLGFGKSSQPSALLNYEPDKENSIKYSFDLWGNQISTFCAEVIKSPVYLVGNSIGGVIALKAAEILKDNCKGIILIDCAQRTMDDKRLKKSDILMNLLRPVLKTIVRQRLISNTLFTRAANPKVIKRILEQAYPSGKNIDKELIEILYQPSQRKNSKEAFRGFINLFDDYLATDLFDKVNAPIQLIWGEKDPWESLNEAKEWKNKFRNIKRLDVIKNAGHCPHDEEPEETNKLICEFLQETK